MEVNFFIAFIFGFLSFVSPCVLPLVPGYLAIFSESEDDIKTRLFGSVQFTLGFSLVFISLAAIATNVGSFFSRNSESLSRVSGLIIIFFGLMLMIPSLNNKYFYSSNYIDIKNFNRMKNFVLGLTFAFGFTPCIGPVLGALLTLSSSSNTINQGISLLIFYSFGLAIPFILLPIFSTKVNLKSKIFTFFKRYSSYISGTTLVAIGALIFSDRMYILASFFQDIFIRLNLERLSNI